jgi:hypothetical protein
VSGALKYTLVVRNPATLDAVALRGGEPVPDWAADLVDPADIDGADAKATPRKAAAKATAKSDS